VSNLEAKARAEHRLRVSKGCVEATHRAGQVEGGEGSAIDLPMALSGVTDALAMLLVETMPTSQKDRREVADQVRRQLIVTANRFAEMKAAGDWGGWGMAEIGGTH
jgi:hypothetical protein